MSPPVRSVRNLTVMTAAQTLNPAGRTRILDLLATEWKYLTVRAADLDAVRRWGLPGGPIRTLDDVLLRSGYLPSPSARASTEVCADDAVTLDAVTHDAYLVRLLAIARHDPLAARIVLQRIIPALCALARRHSTNHAAQFDLLDELIGNAWPSICSYPIERRPRWVVPNLVRDIGFQTIVRPARRRNASERPMANNSLRDCEQVADVEPLDELVDLLNEARMRGMSQGDLDLICQIVTLDRPANVARVRQVTTRTVRNRRDAIVHRLRDIAAAA